MPRPGAGSLSNPRDYSSFERRERLDGIVEEHFPIEAANSLTAFFTDGDDEAKMMSNIHVLTESSERVLDLERSSVIHMTEHRLR